MTITQRLLLTFSLLSAALVSMVIVAIVVAGGFQSRFQYVQENTVPSLLDIGRWWTEVTHSLSGYTAIRVQPTPAGRPRSKSRLIPSSVISNHLTSIT